MSSEAPATTSSAATNLSVTSDPSEIPTFCLLPSHKLSHKLTRILSALYPSTTPLPSLYAIGASAPASHTSKLVELEEQGKRKVEEKGDNWYQYNVISTSVANPRRRDLLSLPRSKLWSQKRERRRKMSIYLRRIKKRRSVRRQRTERVLF